MTGLAVGGEVPDTGSFAVAATSGAVLVLLGFAAASRCRRLARRSNSQRARLALLSLAVGTALGVANLAANWTIAEAEPELRAVLAERIATVDPLDAVVTSPILEEVAIRLFFMSALAWVVFRFTRRPTLAFAIAVIGSASFFALLHLARPFPGDPALAAYYRAARQANRRQWRAMARVRRRRRASGVVEDGERAELLFTTEDQIMTVPYQFDGREFKPGTRT